MEIKSDYNSLNMAQNAEIKTQEIDAVSIEKANKNQVDGDNSKALASSVQLSSEGKLIQAIDETSDKIDSILEKHLTTEQKQSLGGIYKQLDGLFESDNLSQMQEKKVDALFEQANSIYNTSIEKLSSGEHETIDKLSNKMDKLSEQLAQSETSNITVDKQVNDGGNVKGSEVAQKAITNSGGELSEVVASKKKSKKKALTVAQLNALSVAELNKLSPSQVKKLNAKQLNKLNASLLNTLALPQLKQLSSGNIAKLNQMQQEKLI